MPSTSDTRVAGYEPMIAPGAVLTELPLHDQHAATVAAGRETALDILAGRDDRLLLVVGPCSVHDPNAALDYAKRLAGLRERLRGDLDIVMRVYFEKPRTTIGWKGLINDPGLDGSYDVHRGLRTARSLLLDIIALGLPVGCEWLDPITPQYLADAVAWGAVGARTTESQVHRQLASGLSMPVGFKNGTDGNSQVALDACRAAAAPHTFFGVDAEGQAAVVTTSGNSDCHLILRGGRTGPNYSGGHVAAVESGLTQLEREGLPGKLMIDASHGNSRKDHRRQPGVAHEIGAQVAAGQDRIAGVMLESFLIEGAQDPGTPDSLTYGQSVTDTCMSWETTERVLENLAGAVRARRRAASPGEETNSTRVYEWPSAMTSGTQSLSAASG